MSRQLRWMAILMVALTGAGCATDPLKIAQHIIPGQIKTIALAPVGVPPDLGHPEPVMAKFESLLEAKLREGGFSIVPSREFVEIWKRMAEQVGGYFDPVTGKREEAKFRAVQEHALRELSATFKADALVQARIQPVTVPFRATEATWHGTSQLVEGGWQRFGTIGALSLVITIVDSHGVVMYTNAGGIQLLAEFKGNQLVLVPRHELFTDEERNAAAVNIALGPLVKQSGPTVAPREKR